jgi:hypothetical protein
VLGWAGHIANLSGLNAAQYHQPLDPWSLAAGDHVLAGDAARVAGAAATHWDAALGYLIVAVAVVIHDINAPRSLGRAGRLCLAAAPLLLLNSAR